MPTGPRSYPWIDRDSCGTCGGREWRVIKTPYGLVARCAACLPRLKEDEQVIDRVTLGPEQETVS